MDFFIIRNIYEAIFGARCDFEDLHSVLIKMNELIEFQVQGIGPNDGWVFMQRNSRLVCNSIVKDLKNSFPYSPFQHIEIYRTQGRCKNANVFWKCKHCKFFCELLDQHLIENHLCCSCTKIPLEEKNGLQNNCIQRAEQHLIDLNRYMLDIFAKRELIVVNFNKKLYCILKNRKYLI